MAGEEPGTERVDNFFEEFCSIGYREIGNWGLKMERI
jgi:hypothetical protein